MFNGFGIQEAFWMGVIIATIAVVATGIVVIVAWLYTVIDTMIGKVQAWYKRYKWNKLPFEEKQRILRQRMMYMPDKYPLTVMFKRLNRSLQSKPEYEWEEKTNLKPPQTSQETPQTPERPHDESPPE